MAIGGDVTRLERLEEADDWVEVLARHFKGAVNVTELTELAKKAADPKKRAGQLCEAEFYVGLAAEQRGDRAEAKKRYLATVATGKTSFVEYEYARCWLARAKR